MRIYTAIHGRWYPPSTLSSQTSAVANADFLFFSCRLSHPTSMVLTICGKNIAPKRSGAYRTLSTLPCLFVSLMKGCVEGGGESHQTKCARLRSDDPWKLGNPRFRDRDIVFTPNFAESGTVWVFGLRFDKSLLLRKNEEECSE